MADYLFLATIPSISKFITASRKTEDIWAGSMLIAYLLKKVLKELNNKYRNKIELIFPSEIPTNNSEFADISNKILLRLTSFTPDEIHNLAEEVKKTFNELLYNLIVFAFEKCKTINSSSYEKYKEFAYYQTKNTVELFWACLRVDEDYKRTRQKLEGHISYLKDSSIRKDEMYQGYELITPENFTISFYEFQKKEKYEKYCRGAYTCTVCKENSIIGGTIVDYKGNDFWRALWEGKRDKFKKGERLCGFCLIKRFLREYFKKQAFPSTSEIASTSFKTWIIGKGDFISTLIEIFGIFIEKLPAGHPVAKFQKELENLPDNRVKKLLLLDGEWLMADTWKNSNNYSEYSIKDHEAKEICQKLDQLYKRVKVSPSEMFAILKLDGDNMGAKIAALDKEGHKKLSELQREFVNKAKEIIIDNYGAAVYIGGDDVLAFLPIKTTIKCAKKIREEYETSMECMKKLIPSVSDNKFKFTLTGAVLIAHHLLPLQYVTSELYNLEREAKLQEGKDSICVGFIKHSLSSARVVLEWDKIDKIKALTNIPKSLVYQLSRMADVVEVNDGIDFHGRKALIKTLLKRKVNSDKIEDNLSALIDVDDSLNFRYLGSILKVFNIVMGDSYE